MKNNLKKNSFLEGTLIASFSLLFIKVLGALYVIPFYRIIGEQGGTLYSYAYNIYSLFLNISTAGIPVAISMIISEYLALEMYDAKERAKKIGTYIISILAILSFIIVFFGSDYLAGFLLSDLSGGHSLREVSLVIKTISFCLLVIPFLSIIRGYLQGHKYISYTSYSQVLEQVIRIIVVLLGSYTAIYILKYNTEIGVCVSLSGAFFGGLVAYIYLKLKIIKNKSAFPTVKKKDLVKNKTIFKNIINYSIPIVMVAIIDNLYNLIDIRLIVRGLNYIGYNALESETVSGIVATWAPKICTIILAIATALTTNIIPHVTSSFIKKDYKDVNNRINQALETMLVITVPMSVMLFMLSKEAYTLFYGYSNYGNLILKFSAISHILFGTWTILNTSLQSIKKFKLIYYNSIIGLGINALLDIPIIVILSKIGITPYIGTVISSIIGYTISMSIVIMYFKKEMKFEFKSVINVLKRLVFPVLVIIVFIYVSKTLIVFKYSRINSLMSLIIHGIIGMIIYLYFTNKNGVLNKVLGDNFLNKLLKKLHIINKQRS